MSEVRAHAEVRIWNERIGAVAELENGRILFEYDPDFARQGIELSPVHLPTSLQGPQSFDELVRSPAFDGLPGLLADSLPDAFGNKVIRAWFTARGRGADALSPVQRLLYVGERALGALTFHPATNLPLSRAEQVPLELAELVIDARRIVEGKPDVAIPEIYRIGSSAGGMRPKAVVLYDQHTAVLKSAYARPGPNDVPSILKFDGVGDGSSDEHLGHPQPFNRIEAAYTEMARRAGLDVPTVQILEQDGYAHILIQRFDLADGERIHQHTLGGLLHVDYNQPAASSYEEYLRVILQLGMAGAAIEQGFRRAVFNVMAINQDDHVKNLSFHLRRGAEWSLAPAYDLTFAKGRGFTRRHQLRLADRTEGIMDSHLVGLAKAFSIKRPERIIEEVRAAVRSFRTFAEAANVAERPRERVAQELEARERAMTADT